VRILDIRRGAGNEIATFDIELSPHLRMFNMILRRTEDGRVRSFPPKVKGKHCASLHPALAEQITAAAKVALAGARSHDHR